jgi:small subunit ribosomal protein S15
LFFQKKLLAFWLMLRSVLRPALASWVAPIRRGLPSLTIHPRFKRCRRRRAGGAAFQTEQPEATLSQTHKYIMSAINKTEVIQQYKTSEKDTGSSEVQIALLSARIAHLTEHLRAHSKDFHSRRGLIMMTNRRRKLLNYLKDHALEKYNEIIQKLNLRR